MFIRQEKKQIQAGNNVINDTEYFMSGDPYKGDELTAGVRATQIYYNAWTGTVHMKCWHFGSMNLLYATKTKAPHWAKRLLDIRGAHNWHSYNEGENKTVVSKDSFVIAR